MSIAVVLNAVTSPDGLLQATSMQLIRGQVFASFVINRVRRLKAAVGCDPALSLSEPRNVIWSALTCCAGDLSTLHAA